MITLKTYPLLAQNIKLEFEKTKSEFPSVREQLAIVQHGMNDMPVSDHTKFSNVSTADDLDDAGNAKVGEYKQGFRVTLNKYGVGNLVEVSKQTRLYQNAQQKVMEMVRGQVLGTERRIELDLAAHLFYAWASSYTRKGKTVSVAGPDGNPLMYSAHSCNGSTNTYNNQVDAVGATHTAISTQTLEKLVNAGNNSLNESDGKNFPFHANTIITAQNSIASFEVARILSSLLYPSASTTSQNNANNPLKGLYQHLVVPYLDFDPATETRDTTKSNYCFVAQLGDVDNTGFRMEFAQDPMVNPQGTITESGVWQWMVDAYYSVGLTASNFIVGTKGDNTLIA